MLYKMNNPYLGKSYKELFPPRIDVLADDLEIGGSL